MKTQLRAISPVIATVIILAVTIAIAIAVVGWITGLFGATTAGTPSVQIMSDSKICAGNTTTIKLHLKNDGSATANVYKVEIKGVGETNVNIQIAPGQDLTQDVTINAATTPGTIYTVVVYVKELGTPITTTIVAESCSS